MAEPDESLRILLAGADGKPEAILLTVAAREWPARMLAVDMARLILAASTLSCQLTMPIWTNLYPADRRSGPARALEVAEACLKRGSADAREHARLVAKRCTKARANSLGYAHRTAEAARGVALAAAHAGSHRGREALRDAFGGVEEELVYRDSIAAVYGREKEIRTHMLAVIRPILLG